MVQARPEAAEVAELNRLHRSRLAWLDQAGGMLLPFQANYPDAYQVPDHRHRRSQLMQALSGVLLVMTPYGRWIVPPGHAMWVPGGVEHSVRMLGKVTMRSVYVEEDAAPGLPSALTVYGVTTLMDNLLQEALRLPDERKMDGRDGYLIGLLLHEIGNLPARPLDLPMPTDPRLLALCLDFVAQPTTNVTIDDWAEKAGMSRRTFTRSFQKQSGVSLSTWRQQAILFAALPRLAEGQAITNVALDLGYDSVPAFTTMFKRMLGTAPRDYLRNAREIRASA